MPPVPADEIGLVRDKALLDEILVGHELGDPEVRGDELEVDVVVDLDVVDPV